MYWYIYLEKKMTKEYELSRMSPVLKKDSDDLEDQTITNTNNYTHTNYNNVIPKCEVCNKEKYDPDETITDGNTNESDDKSCTIKSNTTHTIHPYKYKADHCDCTTLNSDNIQSSENTSNTGTYGMGNLGL